jgi:hypothetical protein
MHRSRALARARDRRECGDSSSRFAELIDQQPMQTVPTKNVIAPRHSPGHQTSAVRASVVARCHTDPMADPMPLKRGFIVLVETPQPDGGQLSRRGYLVAAESASNAKAAVAPYQHPGETMYILGAVPTLAFQAIRVRLGAVFPLDD